MLPWCIADRRLLNFFYLSLTTLSFHTDRLVLCSIYVYIYKFINRRKWKKGKQLGRDGGWGVERNEKSGQHLRHALARVHGGHWDENPHQCTVSRIDRELKIDD